MVTVSKKSATQAANDFGGFKDNTALYQGQDVLTQDHGGMGSWMGFFTC